MNDYEDQIFAISHEDCIDYLDEQWRAFNQIKLGTLNPTVFGSGGKSVVREKKMKKKCEVNLLDGNGKATIGKGSYFITPAHTGFLLFDNPNGDGVELHCCADWADVIKLIGSKTNLDLTQDLVCDSL